jgi:hypothetical protein
VAAVRNGVEGGRQGRQRHPLSLKGSLKGYFDMFQILVVLVYFTIAMHKEKHIAYQQTVDIRNI